MVSSSSKLWLRGTRQRTGWSQTAATLSPRISVPPLPPISYHWIVTFGQQCWSLTISCSQSQQQFPSWKTHRNWSGLPCSRNPSTTLQATADLSIGQWWTMTFGNKTWWSHKSYVQFVMSYGCNQFVSEKVCEFRDKLIWIVKIEGVLL